MEDKRDVKNFKEHYDRYVRNGFKAVRCKGYSRKNPKKDYNIGKQPIDKGFTSDKFSGKSLEECIRWINDNGWIGFVLPKGVIGLDNEIGYSNSLISSICNKHNITPGVHKTTKADGYHFLFKSNGSIPGESTGFTRFGFGTTYRAGGRNQLILAPMLNRQWEKWVDVKELPIIPDELKPYSKKDKLHVMKALSWTLGNAFNSGALHGYDDIENKYMAFLLDRGFTEEEICAAFEFIFRYDYDDSRTRYMYNRTKEKIKNGEAIQGAGSFINEIKNLKNDVINVLLRNLTNNGKINNSQAQDGYFIDPEGYLCRFKQINNGVIPVRLANFEARIMEEIIEDNGVEQNYSIIVEGIQPDKVLPPVEVAASSFSTMNWVHKWGSKAILEPGTMNKDYVRHSIQVRSTPKRTTCYTHTGWRQIKGEWTYLTGSGAIGMDNITVKLSKEDERYSLPLKMENEIEAIKTSLSFIKVGKTKVTYPLLCNLYLSPLTTILNPMPNYSVYIHGDTGLFKTTISILLISHFGTFHGIDRLPNFDDSANSIERRAFVLKDVLMPLDDYHPSTQRYDAHKKETTAQRIIRAFSNRSGRGRLNPDSSDKGRYEPRGMLIVTGEELVSLQSTLARTSVIEISKGDIYKDQLTILQKRADLLPHAMASYILWLKDHINEIREEFPKRFRELRNKAFDGNIHLKLPEQMAFSFFAIENVLSWAYEKGAIGQSQAKEMAAEVWDILKIIAIEQSQRLATEDPVNKFIDILKTLLTQGKVKIQSRDDFSLQGDEKGDFIGYFDDMHLYLIPTALWHSLEVYCREENTRFPVKKDTLYRNMRKRNLIAIDGVRNTVRETIHGDTQRFLKIYSNGIYASEVK